MFLQTRVTTSKPNGFEMIVLFYNIVDSSCNFLGNG